MARTGFGPVDAREKGKGYHGSAGYLNLSPDVAKNGVKSLNIDITMEEALKLRLALDSCLHAVNRYNRNTKQGRSTGICLSLKTGSEAISVIETVLRSKVATDDVSET
jgi:hypothetical protein